MDENDINGWTIDQETEHSILLSSPEGELAANREDDDLPGQTWYIHAELPDRPPVSWKARVENRDELLTESIPEIINDRLPKYSESSHT